MSKPLISVCIPVYNGAEYIEETLKNIYAQNYTNIEILISIDLSSDQSVALCYSLKKPTTKIFISNVHLGWVENCNFLIGQCSGAYFSIIPQDDLIPFNYFEKLLHGFTINPHAVNCFPYILCFGNLKRTIHQKSITGPLHERIKDVIQNHNVAVSFRGLVKNNLPDPIRFLNTYQHQNIMADSIWMAQHAIAGDLCSIDVPYYKRFHRMNEHTSWINKSKDDKILAWTIHCATLFNITVDLVENKEKHYQYCIKRLLNQKLNHLNFSTGKSAKELLKKFDEKIKSAVETSR